MFYSSRRMEGLQNIYTGTVSAFRHRIRLESEYAASHRAGGARRTSTPAWRGCVGWNRPTPSSPLSTMRRTSAHGAARKITKCRVPSQA